MKKLLLVGAATLCLCLPGPSGRPTCDSGQGADAAAHLQLDRLLSGGHVGGGRESKDIADPVQLVQDQLSAAR